MMKNKPVIDVKMKQAFQDLDEEISRIVDREYFKFMRRFINENIDQIPMPNYHFPAISAEQVAARVKSFNAARPPDYIIDEFADISEFLPESVYDRDGNLRELAAVAISRDFLDSVIFGIRNQPRIEIEPMHELYSNIPKWNHRMAWDPGIVIDSIGIAIGHPEEIRRVKYQDPIFPYRLNICLHQNIFKRLLCWVSRNLLFEMCSKWRV